MRQAIELAAASVKNGGADLPGPFSQRTRPIIQLLHGEAVEPFRLWAAKSDKTEY